MNRRHFLAVTGLAVTAGCTSDSDGSSDGGESSEQPTTTPTPQDTQTATPTSAETETPTRTPTPTPEAPKIQEVNLISKFEEYGDVKEESISSATSGSRILIGIRHQTWVHDGEFRVTVEGQVYNADGNRVGLDRYQDEQLVDGDGPSSWENVLEFTADWEPGEYTAEVRLRDDITGKVSDTGSVTFEITEPEPKLEVLSASRYTDDYNSGVRGTVKNVSEQTLSYAEVTVIFLDSEGRQLENSIDNTTDLRAGREWKFDVLYLGDEDFAEFEINLDWTVAQ